LVPTKSVPWDGVWDQRYLVVRSTAPVPEPVLVRLQSARRATWDFCNSRLMAFPRPRCARAGHIYIDLVDGRLGRKDNNAAETNSIPSVLRFPRSRTNPTRRLARGVSGRTSIFAAGMCPAPKDRLGTIEAPSPTATTLFIASTLSNSINGLGGGPASASQSVIVRRRADFSLPRISGHRDRKAGVTLLGISPSSAGRMATSYP
jgi:hypothetical protein